MRRALAPLLSLSLSVALAACGGDDGGSGNGQGEPDAGGSWQTLLEGDWSLGPLEEGYYCVYATVPRDLYIKAFRPLIPLGTHHTVLTLYEGNESDGVVRCGSGTHGQNMIYGSGVGSPEFHFPDGIGLHLRAGQRLLLNLHLYNAGDDVLEGTSGVLFQEATAEEIEHEAEIVLAGPVALDIEPGVQTEQGTCRISSITDEPIHIFALSGHMHRLGRQIRSVITRGDQEIELQDEPYDFENQTFHLVEPHIELLPGDILTTYCTYENDTGETINWGNSSDAEMCFTDLFYYPAQGATFICPF